MRVNSKSSSTMPVSRRASRRMMTMPRRVSAGSIWSAERMVSPQPVMAVRGVRSSWDTEEINSDCIFSDWAILADMSLMVSASSPISSSWCFWIRAP